MSIVPNVFSKRRKKSESSKPQSQLNKCLNEKRRREQENIYIEELAELISASISDMSSLAVKPDKCAILQETVNQIRRIKQQESGQGDELQQSEVSSSKPTILATDILGPLLLEALDGFLYVVNTEGKIEFVSENVISFLKYQQDDLVGKNIYNIIHTGDHARFSSNLLPMTVGNGFGWSADSNSGTSKSRSFNCRFLIKTPDDQEDTMEDKQTRPSQYENMQISAILLPHPGDKADGVEVENADIQNCLVCVARRIPTNEKSSTSVGIEQFTTRLDLHGKILAIDTSGVSATYSQYLNKDLVGRLIQECCHQSDLHKLNQHLKETLQTGSHTSAIYRFQVYQDKYVHIQTKSKRFSFNQVPNESEFIMATHSIIRDGVLSLTDTGASSSSGQRNPSPATPQSSFGSGLATPPSSNAPTTTSGINGGLTTSISNSSPSLATTSYSGYPPLSPSQGFTLDLGLEIYPTSSWELGGSSSQEGQLNEGLTPSLGMHTFSASNSPATPVTGVNSSSIAGCPRPPSQNSQSNLQQHQPTSSAFSPAELAPNKGSPVARSPAAQLSSTSSPAPGRVTPFNSITFSPVQTQPNGKSSPSTPSSMKKGEESLTPSGELSGLSPQMGTSGLMAESLNSGCATHKLRNLLTQGIEEVDSSASTSLSKDSLMRNSTDCDNVVSQRLNPMGVSDPMVSNPSTTSRNENNILRELLNQEDEDMSDMACKQIQRVGERTMHQIECKSEPSSDSQKKPVCNNNNNNNMLRRLLNDDDIDKSYRNSQDLLIQHLLKADSSERMDGPSGSAEMDPAVQLAVSQMYMKQVEQHAAMKRKSEGDAAAEMEMKRSNLQHAHLAGQNPMLASMLAKTPRTLPSVPTSLANTIMTQLPQERLPKNLEKKLLHTPIGGALQAGLQHAMAVTSNGVQLQQIQSQGMVRNLIPAGMMQDNLQADSQNQMQMDPQTTMGTINAGTVSNVPSSTSSFNQRQNFLGKILSNADANQLVQTLGPNVVTQLASGNITRQQLLQLGYQNFPQVMQRGSQPTAISLQNALNETHNIDPNTGLTTGNQPADPLLSEILDQVWSLQQDMNIENPSNEESMLLKLLDDMIDPSTSSPPITTVPTAPSQDINEKMAISAIQRQLMSYEAHPNSPGSMPTVSVTSTGGIVYSQSQAPGGAIRASNIQQVTQLASTTLGALTAAGGYQPGPPPAYASAMASDRRAVANMAQVNLMHSTHQVNINIGVQRANLPQYVAQLAASGIPANAPPHLRRTIMERRQKMYLQQQQKRLLAQQQQQQLTMQTQQSVETLTTSGPTFSDNIGDVLNNTVAPNVSLQRSAGVPEQLSPRFSSAMVGQLPSPAGQPTPSQLSPGQRLAQPYSPLSQQSFPNSNPQQAAYQQQSQSHHRLSPHPLPSYPNQSPVSTQSPVPVPSSATPGDPRSPHLLSPQSSAQNQWNHRPPPSPVSGGNLQQQNPMLNAQLSGQNSYTAQQQARFPAQQQRQMTMRSMPSPNSVPGSQNSPYSGQGETQFATQTVANLYQQQQATPQQVQQQRIQRTVSMPVRVNSPRTPQSSFVSDPLLSPQPQMSPGYSQSLPSTPVTNYGSSAMQSANFNLVQDSSHFSFDQNAHTFSSNDRSRSGSGNIPVSSDYVRQELRSFVDARTQQQQRQAQGQQHHPQSVQGQTQQSTQLNVTSPMGHSVNQSLSQEDLEQLGLSLEMGPGDGPSPPSAVFSQSLLGIAANQDISLSGRSTNSPRVEEVRPEQKKSLLQKLLSEPP